MDFEWFRPNDGFSRIRILADLGKNVFHWAPLPQGGIGRQPCPDDGSCPLCNDPFLNPGYGRRHRRLYSVIDRGDGRIKLFEMPEQMYRQLDHAVKAAPIRNKNLSRFDVRITRDGRGPHLRYGVIICHPKPLKASERQEALDFLSRMIARLRPNCRV
jgi:hypothetical protein